jgi:ferredoxin
LCFTCHSELDQGKNLSKAEREEMWIEAYLKTIAWLFDNELLTLNTR